MVALQPYVVHFHVNRFGMANKLVDLRTAGFWLMDPPSYYAEGNFMTYENDVVHYINALIAAASEPLPHLFKHFHAVSYQMAAMRDAFAIADSLDRVLVRSNHGSLCLLKRAGVFLYM